MPRLIFKCPHIPAGGKGSRAKGGNYVRYIATRDGVEPLTGGYLGYIAQRPGVQRMGAHGLFSGAGRPPVLSRVAEEVSRHTGTVWLPILSLTRTDAARLGYDNARQWQALLSAHEMELAEAMKIPYEQFRWYAAFHNEGDHPHVHMVCYSAGGKSGYLNKGGIARIKTMLAQDIFRQELTEIYREQTVHRDTLGKEAEQAMADLLQQMKTGTLEDVRLEELLVQLAEGLTHTTGKKQYGYLKPPLKKLTDEIVDWLAQQPRIAAAYELWYLQREEVLRTYRDDLPERMPLSKQKEFRQIRNLVVREAAKLAEGPSFGAPPQTPAGAAPAPAPGISTKSRLQQPALCDNNDFQLIASAALAASRLLRQVGELMESQDRKPAGGFSFVDSKLKRKIREKKLAQGHKADDHEPGWNGQK